MKRGAKTQDHFYPPTAHTLVKEPFYQLSISTPNLIEGKFHERAGGKVQSGPGVKGFAQNMLCAHNISNAGLKRKLNGLSVWLCMQEAEFNPKYHQVSKHH